MKKNTIKLNEKQLRQIVAESVKTALKEGHISSPVFYELEKALDKAREILSEFVTNMPQKYSEEFMKGVGKEWNDLWESLGSIEETVIRINNPRGISDGDLSFDDLS